MINVRKMVTGVVFSGILVGMLGSAVTMATPVTRTGYRTNVGTMYYSYTSTPGKNASGKDVKNAVSAYIGNKSTEKYSTKTGANNVTSGGTYTRANAHHGIGNDIYSLERWQQN